MVVCDLRTHYRVLSTRLELSVLYIVWCLITNFHLIISFLGPDSCSSVSRRDPI